MMKLKNEQVRHTWVAKQLAKLKAGSRMLDAGCGRQRYRKLCQHLEYVSQDFGQYDGTGDGQHLQDDSFSYGKIDIVCDIWNMPMPDSSFDAVLCTEVIEHVPYPERTVQELVRILRAGGVIILTAPFNSIPHMTPYYFFSGFHENFLRHHLREAGCEAIVVTPYGNAWSQVLQELLRLRHAIPSRMARWAFVLVSMPAIAGLGIGMKVWPREAAYAPFGYMVSARKRADAQ